MLSRVQTVSTDFENRWHAALDHSTAAMLAGDTCYPCLSPERAETEPCCCRALQVIALQAAENPAMMAVVAQLQHAVLTMPWEVRIAAAQAIAKVAVRSEEPYRIHCYSILRSLAASGRATGNDPLGEILSSVVVQTMLGHHDFRWGGCSVSHGGSFLSLCI